MKIYKYFAIVPALMLLAACGTPAPKISKEAQALLPSKSLVDSASYLIGVNFGSWIQSNSLGVINYDKMLEGIKDFTNAKGTIRDSAFYDQFKVDPNKMNEILDDFLQKRRTYLSAVNKELGASYIERFLQEDGAQQTESGLAYKIIEPGSDKKAVSDRDTVWVNYKGTLIDGTPFDDGQNIPFVLDRVFEGWKEGVKLVGEGGTIKLVIPCELAYGERGNRTVEAGATILYDLTVNKVGPYVEPEW